MARDPKTFENVPGLPDGTVYRPRWVVTDRGVMLTNLECADCHFRVTANRTVQYAVPLAPSPPGTGLVSLNLVNRLSTLSSQRLYSDEPVRTRLWRMFGVPWVQDDQLERADPGELAKRANNAHGVIPRVNGSPYYGTRVPDLHLLRYSKYIDATGTHRLRGPEDIARYAAIINSADPMDFGTHRFLSDAQRRVGYRFAD
jgi:hypothetical protein